MPVLSRHLTDCETAPINPGGNTKPLYINGVQRYFRSPPPERSHAYSPLKYFMLTLSTLTLFVKGLVPIHGSSVFIRATTSVHAPRSFLCLTPWQAAVRAPCIPRPRVIIYKLRASRSLCSQERSVWTGLVSGCPTRISRHDDVSPARRCVLPTISSQVEEQRATNTRCFFSRISDAENFVSWWKKRTLQKIHCVLYRWVKRRIHLNSGVVSHVPIILFYFLLISLNLSVLSYFFFYVCFL